MTSGRATQDLPIVVRLGNTATCGCGEPIASGERVGAIVALDRVFCLACMADLQSGRRDLADLDTALAAAEYNARVLASAEELVNRLHATRLLGSLAADPAELLALELPRVEPRS